MKRVIIRKLPEVLYVAYRGYLIRGLPAGITITRDGYHIAWAGSVEDARRQIDELV